MVKNYMNFLYEKAQKYAQLYNKYDKQAQNPFLELIKNYNPFKPIHEQTFVWVTKPDELNS